MDSWIFWGVVIFFVVIEVVSLVNGYLQGNAARDAAESYQNALNALKDDPNNPDYRTLALLKGRQLAEINRQLAQKDKNATVTLFDETAIRNDIEAVVAGRGASHSNADEILKLDALRRDGVISDEDYGVLKGMLITKPSGVHDVIRMLRGLKDLEREGVLSEGEFNMKKWDILSKNISR